MSGADEAELQPMKVEAERVQPAQSMGEPLQATEPLQPTKVTTKRLQASAAAVGTLRTDVAKGRLKLDPAAGREVQELLAEQMEQVDAWLRRADDLGRHAPLGQNPVGEAMAGKFVDRTTSEGDSFTGVLAQYRRVLDEARDAVEEAMRRYRTADEHAVDMFQNLESKL